MVSTPPAHFKAGQDGSLAMVLRLQQLQFAGDRSEALVCIWPKTNTGKRARFKLLIHDG